MQRKGRLRKASKYELCVYQGVGGIWQSVRKVDSIKEASDYLNGKQFHSAELFTTAKPFKVVRKFKGRHTEHPWLH
jgi:hypothetical protein